MITVLAVGAAAGLGSAPARAQETDWQLWSTSAAEVDLGENLALSGEFVARFSDSSGGLAELQYQADLELDIRPGLSIAGGYSFVPRYDQGELATREHRIRQQVTARLGAAAGGTVEGRLRLEQRWRDDGNDTLLRLRPQIAWSRPIGPDDLTVRLMHESFTLLNDTDWGGEAGYNRLRNQVSLRRKLGDTVTGELGYLNQYDLQPGSRDRLAHALTLWLAVGF